MFFILFIICNHRIICVATSAEKLTFEEVIILCGTALTIYYQWSNGFEFLTSLTFRNKIFWIVFLGDIPGMEVFIDGSRWNYHFSSLYKQIRIDYFILRYSFYI